MATEREMLDLMSRPTKRPRFPDHDSRTCARCGYTIHAPRSRISWVHSLHEDRCGTSTPQERIVFRKTGRWPRKSRTT